MTFVLDATNKALKFTVSAGTDVHFTSHWADATTSGLTEGQTQGTSNGSTAVDAVAAPAASTRRVVKLITFHNTNTTTSRTVTLVNDVGGTSRTIAVFTLAPLATWYSDTAATTAIAASFNNAGLKNFLINGDMQIAQRGNTATAITASGYYTADRWRAEVVIAPGPNGQFTQTVASGAGNYPDNSGFRVSLKMECSQTFTTPLGATAECRIEQRIEGQNCLQINFGQTEAQQLTLSFWVKSSNTGTFIAELIQPAGSIQVSAAYTINVADTWEQKSVTFPARTSGTLIVNDNTYQLSAGFWLVAGSNYTGGASLQTTWGNTANRRALGQTNLTTSGNYLQITGIQLEIGTVATNFENLDAGLKLMLCQRYFYLIAKGNGKQISNTVAQYGNQGAGVFKFPVTMRAAGAIVQTSGANYYGIWNNGGVSTFADFLATAFTTDGVLLYRDGLVLTLGQAGYFYTNNVDSFIAINAEL